MSNTVNDNIFFLYLTDQYKKSMVPMPAELETSPAFIDFKTLGFKKKRSYSGGLIVRIDHYEKHDPLTDTYSGLVLTEKRKYDFTEKKNLSSQETLIEYYNVLGEVIFSRNMGVKYFKNSNKIIKMSVMARRHKVGEASGLVFSLVGKQRGGALLEEFSAVIEDSGKVDKNGNVIYITKDYVKLYEKAGNTTLFDLIANSTNPDLDLLVKEKTLREMINLLLNQETINIF